MGGSPVRPKHFENRARREWWAIHIEAWRRSGLSQSRYCRQQRLAWKVFARWLRAVGDAKALEHKAQRKRPRGESRLCRSKRSIATQAFWAMHVEALNWSGLTVTHYAAALKISVHSLRRWRELLEANEISIDWRAQLHPSALPKISTSASSAAKEPGLESGLTDAPIVDAPNRGCTNRRRFSNEEKLAIVRDADGPNTSAAEVCRRHGIVTSMLFRWRVQFGFGKQERAKLASVAVSDGHSNASSAPLVLHELLPKPDGMVEIELADGRRVFAPAGANRNAVQQHIAEREAAS
jgi:transposase-like protein